MILKGRKKRKRKRYRKGKTSSLHLRLIGYLPAYQTRLSQTTSAIFHYVTNNNNSMKNRKRKKEKLNTHTCIKSPVHLPDDFQFSRVASHKFHFELFEMKKEKENEQEGKTHITPVPARPSTCALSTLTCYLSLFQSSTSSWRTFSCCILKSLHLSDLHPVKGIHFYS